MPKAINNVPSNLKMKKNQSSFYMTAKTLFPEQIGSNKSATLFKFGLDELKKASKISNTPWISLKEHPSESKNKKVFNTIPEEGFPKEKVIKDAIELFFDGVPNWRSPELQYNICAPVNITSQALLSLAQELNIHNINNDFAGNCLLAEKLISGMMADLISLKREKVKALFSFGGTASNLYAMKLAINKNIPNVGKTGIPSNVYMMITSSAHFSHKTVADWLGIGVDRLIIIDADEENRSIPFDAEKKARSIIEKGGIIAGISLNGGPFYDFVIDDVAEFVKLRSKLIKDYNLSYTPHIHVDSVIGWIWLMFNNYNFRKNPLNIPKDVLSLIEKQFNRAYKIRLADSWGVDFHKAFGGCPVPCGLFVSNNGYELFLLSKSHRGICDTHHLGGDWSIDDPSDITLETSRSAGSALAALGSLLTMGKNGFRNFLANQITATKSFRDKIKDTPFIVGNPKSLGFNTMIVISPEEIAGGKKQNWESFLSLVKNDEKLLTKLNERLKLFYEWCFKGNDDYSQRLGCSFSRSFHKTKSGKTISGLKYCFVSPHTTRGTIKKEIKKLKEKFKKFSKKAKDESK